MATEIASTSGDVPREYDPDTKAALGITSSLIDVSILLGNLVLTGTILTNRELRKNPFSVLVLLLCLVSIAIGIVILPFVIDQEVNNAWKFGTVWCETWMVLVVFLLTLVMLYLTLINAERLVLALRPDTYCKDMHATVIVTMIGLPWLLASLVDIPLVLKSVPGPDANQLCSFVAGKYVFAAVAIFFIAPMVLITCFTAAMLLAIFRLGRQRYAYRVISMAKSDAIVMCIVNLTFFILWTPFIIVSSVLAFGDLQDYERNDILLGWKWTGWLGMTSLAVVPWLWLIQRDVRNGYKRLLGCEVYTVKG